MAETVGGGIAQRRRRADARRSIEAILAAGGVLLAERPDASMEDVAVAAGVSRQTLYAYFTSREALLHAVLDVAAAEVLAAIDDLDACSPVDALTRFLDAGWQFIRQLFPLLTVIVGLWHTSADQHGCSSNVLLGAVVEVDRPPGPGRRNEATGRGLMPCCG